MRKHIDYAPIQGASRETSLEYAQKAVQAIREDLSRDTWNLSLILDDIYDKLETSQASRKHQWQEPVVL